MKFPTLRFFAAVAIAFTVVNHFGIDLNAIGSNQSWIQSDRAEARRSGGRSGGGSGSSKRSNHRPLSSTYSTPRRSTDSFITPSPVVTPLPIEIELEMETESAAPAVVESSVVESNSSDDPFMQLMMLFLLLGGGIAAGLLMYLIYKQVVEQRSPVE